ncbi:MAG: hypothetical protein ABIO70_21450 [Pseudomonadota bacterium]
MPSPAHLAWQLRVRTWLQSHVHEPGFEALVREHAEAIETLLALDLEPAREFLLQGYAVSPRGSTPWDPIVMLRALLLAILVGVVSINRWVPRLRASELLRVLAGIEGTRSPGVGTFYDYLARLFDGHLRRQAGAELPSEQERARARQARNLRQERTEAKQKRKENAPKSTRLTTVLVERIKAAAQARNPADLLETLASILATVAVQPSFAMGLLGEPGEIVIGSDGSPLRTGACRFGRKAPEGIPEGLRLYSDPDAQWGWDHYREVHYFGHHFHEYCALGAGHDLPLFIALDPANVPEAQASLTSFDRMMKLYARLIPSLTFRYLVQDAGHDSEWHWRYPMEFDITPIIPLATDAPGELPGRRDVQLSPRGLPLCPGKAEMTPWGAFDGRMMFVCPKKAARIQVCPRAPLDDPDWCCRPGAKYAPSLSLSIDQNPRLTPPIARGSDRWKKLYARRSGCERSNAMKKDIIHLEDAHRRRHSFWLARLYLMAILQHAKVWRRVRGEDSFLADLLEQARKAA